MQIRSNFIAFIILSFVFAACKKDSKVQQPSLVGKWILQTQNIQEYRDGIKTTDTTLLGSAYNLSSLQFNSNGTYSGNGYSKSGSGLSMRVSVDSVKGIYSYAGTSLTMSAGIGGFALPAYFTSEVFVIGNATHQIQVSQLTTSNLTIHSEDTFSITDATKTVAVRRVNDLIYSR